MYFFSILPITSWERNTPIHRYPTPLIFSIMSFLLHKFPTWCSIGSMFSSMWGKTFKKSLINKNWNIEKSKFLLYKKFKKFKWDILTTFQTLWDGIFASSVSIFFVFSEETWLVALFGHFWLKCWSLLSPSFWLWSIRQNGQEFSSTSPLDALFYSTVRNQIT